MIYFICGRAVQEDRVIISRICGIDFMNKLLSGLNPNIKSILLAALIIVMNVLAVFIFGLSKADVENSVISPLAFTLSLVLYFIHVPFCIICRISRQTAVTKGIFFYQMIGVISYILFFAGYIAGQGQPNGLTGFFTIFSWWTIGFQDFMVMISRFTGIPFKFTGAVLFFIHAYFTASMYSATKKDIRYEEDRKKEQEYVERTKGRHTPAE